MAVTLVDGTPSVCPSADKTPRRTPRRRGDSIGSGGTIELEISRVVGGVEVAVVVRFFFLGLMAFCFPLYSIIQFTASAVNRCHKPFTSLICPLPLIRSIRSLTFHTFSTFRTYTIPDSGIREFIIHYHISKIPQTDAKEKVKHSYERGRLHIDLCPPKSSLSLNPLPQMHFFKWSTMFLTSFTVPSTVIRPPASGNFLLRNPKMLHTQPEPHFAVRHAYRSLPLASLCT